MSKNKKKTPTKYRPICFYCGGKLCWDSSGDRSEDDDSVVDYYHCMQCVCNAVLLMRYMSLMRRRSKIIKNIGKVNNMAKITKETAEKHIKELLEYIGEDPNRKGLEGTPDRIIRMWKEIFRGYDPSQKPKITTFDNNDDGIIYDNMVIDQGDFHSNCEHHCVWFWGKYWFAYIPNPKGKILGISKIGRVVDYCSARLQIQERLVHDIVDMLKDALGSEYPPLGIALVMKGHHSCKEFRGAKKKGIMTSSYLEGAFKDDPQVRAEFMNLVNGDKYEG